jgi:hypothetical protein
MNIATATTRRQLTAAEAFVEIEAHGISLIPILRGRFWTASVDMYGRGHNSRRAINSLSATSNTSLGAVAALVDKLEAQEGP